MLRACIRVCMILYVEISRVRMSVGRCAFTEATDNALLVTVRASDVVHLRAEHIDLNMYQSSIFLAYVRMRAAWNAPHDTPPWLLVKFRETT